jgi:hypothetical protein
VEPFQLVSILIAAYGAAVSSALARRAARDRYRVSVFVDHYPADKRLRLEVVNVGTNTVLIDRIERGYWRGYHPGEKSSYAPLDHDELDRSRTDAQPPIVWPAELDPSRRLQFDLPIARDHALAFEYVAVDTRRRRYIGRLPRSARSKDNPANVVFGAMR